MIAQTASASWTGAAPARWHRLRGVVAVDPLLDEPRGRLAGRRAEGAEPLGVLERHERPVGGVERDHPDRPAAVDDDPRGLRVEPDVELGRGRHVPVVVGAAHDHDLRDRVEDPRLLLDRHRDVGQRPDRAQDDVAVRRQVGLDQPVDGVPRLERGTVRGGRKVEQVAVDPPPCRARPGAGRWADPGPG